MAAMPYDFAVLTRRIDASCRPTEPTNQMQSGYPWHHTHGTSCTEELRRCRRACGLREGSLFGPSCRCGSDSRRAYTGIGIRSRCLGMYYRLMQVGWWRFADLPVSIECCIDSVEKMSILFAINIRSRWLLLFCIHPVCPKPQVVK